MATPSPSTRPEAGPGTRALVRRRMIQLASFIVPQAAILFLGSGRPGWTAAWVYLVSYVGLIATTRVVVRDPELFAERAQMRKDAKGWDKVLSAVFSVLGLGTLVVAALDARFRWSPPVSTAVAAAGLAAFFLGFGVSVWAMAGREELPGYRDYALQVPHRVVPGVW